MIIPYIVKEREYSYANNRYEDIDKECYTKDQLQEMVNYIESRKMDPSQFSEGSFAFYQFTTFPRSEFSEKFPKFKLKRKNWEYLVIENKHIKQEGGWEMPTSLTTDGQLVFDWTGKEIKLIRRFNTHIANIYKQLNENVNGKIVLLSDLSKLVENDTLELDGRLFDTLDRLLGSGEEDIKIGLNMMLNINYEKYSDEMSFLVFKHWGNKIKSVNKDTRIKYFIKRLENDYNSGTWCSWNGMNYLMHMVGRDISDELCSKITTYCLRNYIQKGKQVILKKYER